MIYQHLLLCVARGVQAESRSTRCTCSQQRPSASRGAAFLSLQVDGRLEPDFGILLAFLEWDRRVTSVPAALGRRVRSQRPPDLTQMFSSANFGKSGQES